MKRLKKSLIFAALLAVGVTSFWALDDPAQVVIAFHRIAGATQGFALSVPLPWDEVAAKQGEAATYNFTFALARQLADNNLMRFLSYACFRPEERDWLGYYDADVYEFPPSMAMKLLLIGAEYKKAKVTLMQNLTTHILSAETKLFFESQRDSLLRSMNSRMETSTDSLERKMLPKIIARLERWKYEDALRKSCDFYAGVIDGVDYSKKVMLDESDIWSILLQGDSPDNAEFFEDGTPYRMQCLFYRLGPKAAKEIRNQVMSFKAKIR